MGLMGYCLVLSLMVLCAAAGAVAVVAYSIVTEYELD